MGSKSSNSAVVEDSRLSFGLWVSGNKVEILMNRTSDYHKRRIFWRVQDLIYRNKRIEKVQPREDFLLRGVLKCTCGVNDRRV